MQVDDRSGAVLEQWSGDQVAWTMARGYAGAFGRKLNAPYVWIPLCLLFLAPFVDVRRPFRLLHLDLLVLLSFGVSHSSSTAARSACRCRSSTRCCSTCSARMLLAGLPAARARRARWCRTRRSRCSWWASCSWRRSGSA